MSLESGASLPRLEGMRILVVEDEYVLGADVAHCFEQAGAEVIGPTATVEQTFQHMYGTSDLAYAVLDVRLHGGLVFPVADKLRLLGVPFLFFTAYDDSSIPSRFNGVERIRKPVPCERVVETVAHNLLSGNAPLEAPASDRASQPRGEITILLPKLRAWARMRTGDAEKADLLVERALEHAIADPSGYFLGDHSLEEWLLELIDLADWENEPTRH